jgi:tRNA (guanine-N7-)-methyltransferase
MRAMTEPRTERLRTYGRIHGRTLRPGRAQLLEELLPRLSLDLAAGKLDPKALAPGATQTWLELGFGAGEHLAAQAEARPDVLMLGAEPFINGAASALRHVHDLKLANVRIHPGDGRELMAALPDACVERVYILFPDPWPKTRHHKRRLINAETTAELARIVKTGGLVRFATDWADYVGWTLERFAASPAFAWTAERAQDWRSPPPDHVTTRYQTKRLGDCEPVFLEFRRN